MLLTWTVYKVNDFIDLKYTIWIVIIEQTQKQTSINHVNHDSNKGILYKINTKNILKDCSFSSTLTEEVQN